jgi:hypothetical protein
LLSWQLSRQKLKDHDTRPIQPKYLVTAYLKKEKEKLSMMSSVYNPSYLGGEDRRIEILGWPQANTQDPI